MLIHTKHNFFMQRPSVHNNLRSEHIFQQKDLQLSISIGPFIVIDNRFGLYRFYHYQRHHQPTKFCTIKSKLDWVKVHPDSRFLRAKWFISGLRPLLDHSIILSSQKTKRKMHFLIWADRVNCSSFSAELVNSKMHPESTVEVYIVFKNQSYQNDC